MKLVFATHNKGKLLEVNSLIPKSIELLSLDDLQLHEEIPETGNTMEANALLKARYVFGKQGLNCFADDSGLEIDALNGAPGVCSARYAGEDKNNEANIALALRNLEGVENRGAQFRTVIALILDGQEHLFEGVVRGHIIHEKRGSGGFGYDPIFVPQGYDQTFAELGLEVKNRLSHRARAMQKLTEFLHKK